MNSIFFHFTTTRRNAIRVVIIALPVAFLFVTGRAAASSGLAEYDQPWEICALCHSLDGNSPMAKFPKLAGQRAEYIEKQLADFLDSRRQNDGGQMSSIVTEIDPADFGRIADWFSSQDPPAPQELDQNDIAIGESLFLVSGCAECHNNSEKIPLSTPVPLLTSQHAAYLTKQLIDFQRDQREHVNVEQVSNALNGLSHDDLTRISAYLAATPRR